MKVWTSGGISRRTYMLANHAEPDVLPSIARRNGELVPGATTQCLPANFCQSPLPFTSSVSQAVNKSICDPTTGFFDSVRTGVLISPPIEYTPGGATNSFTAILVNGPHESGFSIFKVGFPFGARVDESGRKQGVVAFQPCKPSEKSPLTSRLSRRVVPVSGASSPPAKIFGRLRWVKSKRGDSSCAGFSLRQWFVDAALVSDEHPASSINNPKRPTPPPQKMPCLRQRITESRCPEGARIGIPLADH